MTIESTSQPAPETPNKQGFSFLALLSTLTGALSYLLIPFSIFGNLKSWLSIILFFICSPASALVAIITGHRSHRQIKHSNGLLSGIKFSNAGLIMGYVFFALSILTIVLIILITGNLIQGVSNLITSLGIN
jgi:hypothetical protein